MDNLLFIYVARFMLKSKLTGGEFAYFLSIACRKISSVIRIILC